MELQEVLETRQSIRRYKETDVPEADIRQMVDAARLAPSGKNLQNWHFIAIKNRQLKEDIVSAIGKHNTMMADEMEKLDMDKAARFRQFFKAATAFVVNAPVMILVYSTAYVPSGYKEYQLLGKDKEMLRYLAGDSNPGMQSLGAAIENLNLKAVDLGYGTCWLTSPNYAAREIEKVIKKEIGFEKEGYFLAALLTLGVPEENQKSPGRKTIDEIYTFVE